MADAVDRRRSPWPAPLGPRDEAAHPTTHTHALPRLVRVMVAVLTFMVLTLAVTVGVLAGWVVTLRDQRVHQQADQQHQIDVTFCDVLAQLPANSPELDLIRHQRHCTRPGLSPEQMRQLATTGGTP